MLTVLGTIDTDKLQQRFPLQQRMALGSGYTMIYPQHYTYYLCTIPASYRRLLVAHDRGNIPRTFYGPVPRLLLLIGISTHRFNADSTVEVYCAGIAISKATTLSGVSTLYVPFFPNTFPPKKYRFSPPELSNHPGSPVLTGICGVTRETPANTPIDTMLAEITLEVLETTFTIRHEEEFLSHPILQPYRAASSWQRTLKFFTAWESMTHETLNTLDWGIHCTLAELMDHCFIRPSSES